MTKHTGLYLSQQGSVDFPALLDKVQNYFSENYKELLTDESEDHRTMLQSEIRR